MSDHTDKFPPPRRASSDEIDLREIIVLLFRNYKLIFAFSFGFAALAAAYSTFYLERTYESEAVIMSSDNDGGASSAIQSLRGGLFGGIFNQGSDQLTRYAEILNSRALVSSIVDDHDLLERVEIDLDANHENPEEIARNRLIRSLRDNVEVEYPEGVLRISYTNSDPEYAYDIVRWHVEYLQDFLESNVLTQAQATEVFVQERLNEVKEELDQIEAEYIALQKERGVVSLPSQSGMSLDTVAQLRSQLIEKDMEIELYRDILRDSSEIQRLQSEKAQIQQQIDALVKGKPVAMANAGEVNLDVFTPLSQVPELEMEFSAARREYETQVKLLELLREQHEVARIETKKSEPMFQLIDPASMPVLPVGPNRRLITMLGFLLGGILSVFLVLIFNQFQTVPRPMRKLVKVEVEPKDEPLRKSG